MNKLQLRGWHLGRVFNFRNARGYVLYFLCYRVKLPSIKLKTQPEQLLSSLPFDIALPGYYDFGNHKVELKSYQDFYNSGNTLLGYLSQTWVLNRPTSSW